MGSHWRRCQSDNLHRTQAEAEACPGCLISYKPTPRERRSVHRSSAGARESEEGAYVHTSTPVSHSGAVDSESNLLSPLDSHRRQETTTFTPSFIGTVFPTPFTSHRQSHAAPTFHAISTDADDERASQSGSNRSDYIRGTPTFSRPSPPAHIFPPYTMDASEGNPRTPLSAAASSSQRSRSRSISPHTKTPSAEERANQHIRRLRTDRKHLTTHLHDSLTLIDNLRTRERIACEERDREREKAGVPVLWVRVEERRPPATVKALCSALLIIGSILLLMVLRQMYRQMYKSEFELVEKVSRELLGLK